MELHASPIALRLRVLVYGGSPQDRCGRFPRLIVPHRIRLLTQAYNRLRIGDCISAGLGGEVVNVHKTPQGAVANAHVRFGDTTIIVSEAMEGRPASQGTHYLCVENADEAMSRAIAAGGVEISSVGDRMYGDRQGGVPDPSGNIWWGYRSAWPLEDIEKRKDECGPGIAPADRTSPNVQ